MSGHCREEKGRKKLNKQTQLVLFFFFFLSRRCYFSRTIALQIEGTGWSSSEFGFQHLPFYIVFSHGNVSWHTYMGNVHTRGMSIPVCMDNFMDAPHTSLG